MMTQKQYTARRRFLARLYKDALREGNKGAAKFLRSQLEALDVVKVLGL